MRSWSDEFIFIIGLSNTYAPSVSVACLFDGSGHSAKGYFKVISVQ